MPQKITIDDLAKIIKDEFDGVKNEFDGVKNEFDGVKNEFAKAAKERKELKRNLEEIKLKFAYTAWQIDVEELKKRVAKVEQKIGIKHK